MKISNMRSSLLARVASATLAFGLASPAAFGGSVEYYHLDALGSVRVVTDASGAVIERHHYLPYGEECTTGPCAGNAQAAAGQPVKFTGKERDRESGFDYFGARYYGAGTARFTTIDPLFTPDRNAIEPQRWNRYAYAKSNPMKFVDRDGRDTLTVIYGAPYMNYRLSGRDHDVGRNFALAAETRARQYANLPGFDPARDAVVVAEARSAAAFLGAVNQSYASGDITFLSVYSHGTGASISLGGEMGNNDQLANYDLREINYTNVGDIHVSNFASDALIELYGCNEGESIAPLLAEHLGGDRKVRGFTGPAEFANTADGGLTMVPTYPEDYMAEFPQ